MLENLKTLNSGYIKIFKNPKYYHLAFERNVDWEVNTILNKYVSTFHKNPLKIVDFFCANACYGRSLLKKGANVICYDPSKEFFDFNTDCLQISNQVCTYDINSALLANADIYLFLFDNIAYIHPNDVVALINFIYEKLKKQSMLFILSNSGADLSHIDYSKKYINKDKDECIWVKAEWSTNANNIMLNEQVNYVGKRISIINKDCSNTAEWEYYSNEASYNKEDMFKVYLNSNFNKCCPPLFYADFSFSECVTAKSPEVISIFIKD
jgi:hypothetical protein